MAFNGNTYRMNKYRKQAYEHLAQARELKVRITAGTAYEWEKPRVAFFAEQARICMRLHRSCKALKALGA